MRAVAVIGSLAMAGAALADCPTRAAMEAGATAWASYPDGGIVGMRWLGEGMVEETTRYPEGAQEFRMISMGGVFIVDEVDLDGDREIGESRVVTRYPPALAERLPVGPGQDISVTGTSRFADGTAPLDEHVALRSGKLAEVEIAGCLYDGFPMIITYHWGDESFTSMMAHLPDLGVSLEIARLEPGSAPLPFAPERFSLQRP